MIFRTNILEVSSPTCGATPSNIDYSNLALTVELDGEVILNVADLSGAGASVGVTAANSINWGFTLQNTRYVTIIASLDEVWESTQMKITLSKTGYLDYVQEFTVFGFDLGNNPLTVNGPGDPIDYNTDCDIVMIPDSVLDSDGFQQEGFSKFAMYRKPVTGEVYLINLVGNTTGNITYTVTDSESNSYTYGQGSPTIIPNELASGNEPSNVEQSISFYDNGVPRTLYETCSTEQAVSATPTYLPGSTLTTINSNACSGSDFIYNNALEAQVIMDFTTMGIYFRDDNEAYAFNEMDLAWVFTDYEGTQQNTTNHNVTGIAPTYNFPNTTYNFTGLSVIEEGDAVIGLTITTGIYTQTLSLTIEGCNRWKTVQVGNDITIYNLSGVSVDVTVTQMDDCGDFQSLDTATLAVCETYTTAWDDGIYMVTVTDGTTTDSNTYIITEALKTLMDSVLSYLVCNDLTCEAQEQLNILLTNYYFLALYQNQNTENDTFFETLQTTKTAKLYTASKAITNATAAANVIVEIENGSSC